MCNGAPLTTGSDTFEQDVLYFWAVIAIECDFSQLSHPAVMDVDPFLVCLSDALANDRTFATSAYLPFALKD